MNKQELERVSKETGIKPEDIEPMLKETFDELRQNLKRKGVKVPETDEGLAAMLLMMFPDGF
jgi:hypothetical protein